MKKELLEKIYRQIIECEECIKNIKDICDYPDTNDGYISQGINRGKIYELEQNIEFCYELIDIIIGKWI